MQTTRPGLEGHALPTAVKECETNSFTQPLGYSITIRGRPVSIYAEAPSLYFVIGCLASFTPTEWVCGSISFSRRKLAPGTPEADKLPV